MGLKDDIKDLRDIAADPDLFDAHDRLSNCAKISRILDACEKMEKELRWYADPDREWVVGQVWSDRAQRVLEEVRGD